MTETATEPGPLPDGVLPHTLASRAGAFLSARPGLWCHVGAFAGADAAARADAFAAALRRRCPGVRLSVSRGETLRVWALVPHDPNRRAA